MDNYQALCERKKCLLEMLRKVNELILEEEKIIYVRQARNPSDARLLRRIENKLARLYKLDQDR